MEDIASTSIETIIDTQDSSVLNQQQASAIQDLETILDESDSQNKFYDKIGQALKGFIKILSIIKTISRYALWLSRYALWLKYLFAFVIFILLPLGIFALYNVLCFLVKGLILIFKEMSKYIFSKKELQNTVIVSDNILPSNQLLYQIMRNVRFDYLF
jgi:hypothetical protein